MSMPNLKSFWGLGFRVFWCHSPFKPPFRVRLGEVALTCPVASGLVFRVSACKPHEVKSADLGGRVGWLPKAETSFLPYNPGGGGVGGVSRLRFPPGPHLRSSRFSRHPRLRQAPTRRFAKTRNQSVQQARLFMSR